MWKSPKSTPEVIECAVRMIFDAKDRSLPPEPLHSAPLQT